MRQPLLAKMRLVGGTSLALQYGHRFADADPQPMPFMFQQVDWEIIKNEVKYQVEQYNKKTL
jgi:hypothetical protein